MRYSSILIAVLLIGSAFLVKAHHTTLNRERRAEVQSLATLYSERMQSVVQETVEVSKLLEELIVETEGDIDNSMLLLLTRLIYDEGKYFCISYQPNGIVEYIYSAIDTDSLLGQNAFELDLSKEAAKKAKESGETLLTGPYTILENGDSTVVVRTPVYLQKNGKKEFWGFVVIPIYAHYLISQIGISALPSLDYEYSIETSYKGSLTNLSTSQSFNKTKSSIQSFKLADGDWYIFISGNGGHLPVSTELFIFALALAFISFFIYFIVYYFERQHEIMKKIANTDPLTRLNNRKALENYAESLDKANKTSYVVFYVDLNFFKPINDDYGHEVGDHLLIAFADRLSSQFKKKTFIARIGGDEFLLVLEGNIAEHSFNTIRDRIIKLSEKKFNLDGLQIEISSSVGYASYPKDADTFAKVQDIADKNMQMYKKENKKGR